MEFFNVIDNRKTIRKYNQDIPPESDIKRIIESARVAPSSTNRQNWRFIAIYNFDIKYKMVEAIVETYDELISRIQTGQDDAGEVAKLKAYKTYSSFLGTAPVVIAAIETKKEDVVTGILRKIQISEEEIKQMRPASSILSMGAAIENMSLSAHALGYGSCWMCAPIMASKRLKEILEIPEEENLVTLLTIGRPMNNDSKSPLKKPLEDIMEIIR